MVKLDCFIGHIGILATFGALAFGAALPAQADPTGQQILERCQSAYKSLTTYRGKTTVETVGLPDSNTATVQYARTGKIHVDGTLSGAGTFSFVSNGSQTWEQSSLSSGKWEKSASTEMAIGGFTGVSGMAATTIPAILTGASWGNPFLVTVGKVSSVTIDSRSAYKLDCTNALGTVTFWIDKKTFLMSKMHSVQNVPEFPVQPTSGTPPQPKPNGKTTRMETTETYSDVRVNEAIPASTFTKPKGAP